MGKKIKKVVKYDQINEVVDKHGYPNVNVTGQQYFESLKHLEQICKNDYKCPAFYKDFFSNTTTNDYVQCKTCLLFREHDKYEYSNLKLPNGKCILSRFVRLSKDEIKTELNKICEVSKALGVKIKEVYGSTNLMKAFNTFRKYKVDADNLTFDMANSSTNNLKVMYNYNYECSFSYFKGSSRSCNKNCILNNYYVRSSNNQLGSCPLIPNSGVLNQTEREDLINELLDALNIYMYHLENKIYLDDCEIEIEVDSSLY